MASPLLPKRFLFRFAVPCRYREVLWTAAGAKLGEDYRLVPLAALEDQPTRVDMRAAWSAAGVAFSVHVAGKQQAPWCRATRPEDSDGLHIWLDTRDVHNVHRAGRFCHRFCFLPTGSGPQLQDPNAHWMAINRAREQPRPIMPEQLRVHSNVQREGYVLDAWIPSEALTGFDPEEHPQLGFTYAVVDRELGVQTFSAGAPLPYQEDPSLWATLELVR